jgi:2-keto-4-pentenoate hydratase
MSFDPDRAAAALLDARRARRALEALPAEIAPRSVEEGAAAQRALAVLAGAMAEGGVPGGFKVGATAKVMQDYLGLDGPAAGFMAAADLHATGASRPLTGFLGPGVECEIAVRLGSDLPPGPCTPQAAQEAVADLFAATEIVERRYGELRVLGTPTLIADQVFHAEAVLGAPWPGWRNLDLGALRGRILVDGEERAAGRGADLLGHPMNVLAWLAGSPVAAAFGGLRAGQVVLLGSVTPPIWLDAPASVRVEFPPLAPVELRLA